MSPALATDLLWLREPQRRTCLAKVVGTRGPQFVLDRSIFAPTSHEYRHPQPADRGDVWVGGDKRVLVRTHWDRGELRHAVRGTTPSTGADVRCHLDAERRDAASDAHLAMHLVVSRFARGRSGVLVREPEVQGGRQFTITARWASWSPPALKALLDEANEAARRKHEVSYEYVPRDGARGVDAQPFEDGVTVPGPDVLRIVKVGEVSLLPCDGTFPPRTAGLGRIVARSAQVGRRDVRVQFRVERAQTTGKG